MTEDEPKIRITKMEAARRQLRIAIRLWFGDDDPVAIHTLASAAHDILHTLYRRKGMKGLLFDSKEVKDEFRAEWARGIKASANFFKHADRDADGTFEFIPFLNEILLFFSVTALEKMGETLGIEEHALVQWIFISRPEFLYQGAYDTLPTNIIENFRSGGKHEFLKGYLAWQQTIDKTNP
jgi:hypothetical protein